MLPDSREIARWRSDLEDATLPDTCNLLTPTNTPDGMGGLTTTWGTATVGVACRLDRNPTQMRYSIEAMSGGAIQAYQRLNLTLPQGTTITELYRVEHGGVTYNVTSVNAGSWLACVRAEVERV